VSDCTFDADAFVRTGRTRLRFPFTHLVAPVIEGYQRLLAEPDDYRRSWEFDIPGKGDPDDGLVQRRGEKNHDPNEPAYDHKDFMHFRPRLPFLLAERGVDYQRHRPLLEAGMNLFSAVRNAELSVGAALDRVMPGHDILRNMRGCDESVLRVMQYVPGRPGMRIGKCHCDRCFVTIHLAENFPACMLGNELLVAREDDAMVFAGKHMQKLTEGGIQAVEHEVIVQEGSGWADLPRWVIVYFCKYYNV
jgi:hypothetical protein